MAMPACSSVWPVSASPSATSRNIRRRSRTHDPLIRADRAGADDAGRGRENGHGRFPGFGVGAVLAIPLRNDRQDDPDAVGLLLVKTGTAVAGSVNWLATVLGQKLDQIRGRGSLTEELRKLRRERALFTIINSVTDPIMLTDTEGRLIVANSRAEKLFAASEEESEGRRRAVELNNMLFSAALSRTAVEAPSEARELLLVDPSDGSDLLFEVLSTTVEDPREGTGIVSVLRNITDLRRATEQIEENYQKLRVAEAAVRGTRPPQPDHRFGGGSDHRHRSERRDRADERAVGGTVHRRRRGAADGTAEGAVERRALLLVHFRPPPRREWSRGNPAG